MVSAKWMQKMSFDIELCTLPVLNLYLYIHLVSSWQIFFSILNYLVLLIFYKYTYIWLRLKWTIYNCLALYLIMSIVRNPWQVLHIHVLIMGQLIQLFSFLWIIIALFWLAPLHFHEESLTNHIYICLPVHPFSTACF